MIIDLNKFIAEGKPYWSELEGVLDRLANNPESVMKLTEVKRFHYLYQRTSADLAKIMTFSSEPEIRRYLESLVERAYGEIHETRGRTRRIAPSKWFFENFPRTFRRHTKAFRLALAIFLVGFALGGMAITFDPKAKAIIMPYPHLLISPSERVAQEESTTKDRYEGHKTQFSAQLMTHNTRVSIYMLASGITYGFLTTLLLFFNGVILGAVALDFIMARESVFLIGWLLPHGAVEITALILAGQTGLVLAGALIGWGSPVPLRTRLRKVSGDLVTMIFGIAAFLVWAGIVEAFFSQYHEPILPYWLKILFGSAELMIVIWLLWKSGRTKNKAHVMVHGR